MNTQKKASPFLSFRLPSTIFFMLPTYVSRKKWKRYCKFCSRISFLLKVVVLLRINVKIKIQNTYVCMFFPFSSCFSSVFSFSSHYTPQLHNRLSFWKKQIVIFSKKLRSGETISPFYLLNYLNHNIKY